MQKSLTKILSTFLLCTSSFGCSTSQSGEGKITYWQIPLTPYSRTEYEDKNLKLKIDMFTDIMRGGGYAAVKRFGKNGKFLGRYEIFLDKRVRTRAMRLGRERVFTTQGVHTKEYDENNNLVDEYNEYPPIIRKQPEIKSHLR